MLEKLLHFNISAVYLEFQNVFLTDEVLYILNIFFLFKLQIKAMHIL